MDQDKLSKILTNINQIFGEEGTSLEEMEFFINSLIKFYLDNLSNPEQIDLFQEKLNEMIDTYVEEIFDGLSEDTVN